MKWFKKKEQEIITYPVRWSFSKKDWVFDFINSGKYSMDLYDAICDSIDNAIYYGNTYTENSEWYYINKMGEFKFL